MHAIIFISGGQPLAVTLNQPHTPRTRSDGGPTWAAAGIRSVTDISFCEVIFGWSSDLNLPG
jgi:hypothetical protein